MKSINELINEQKINEAAEAEDRVYVVYQVGGSIGETTNALVKGQPATVIFTKLTKEEATNKKNAMNKLLSPGEKKYYRISYKIAEEKYVKYKSDF